MKAQWEEGGERVLLGNNTGGGLSADHVPVSWSLDFSLIPSLCIYTWPYYSVRTQCQTVWNVTVEQVGDGLYFWIRWISALALYSEDEADRSIFVVSLKAHVGKVLLNTPRSYLKFSWFIHPLSCRFALHGPGDWEVSLNKPRLGQFFDLLKWHAQAENSKICCELSPQER
jgi:hypothetical protein